MRCEYLGPDVPARPLLGDWKSVATPTVQGVVTSRITCVDLSSSIRPWSTDLSIAMGPNPQPAFRKVAKVSSSMCRIAGRPAMTTMDSGGNGEQQRFRAGAMLLGFCWKQ